MYIHSFKYTQKCIFVLLMFIFNLLRLLDNTNLSRSQNTVLDLISDSTDNTNSSGNLFRIQEVKEGLVFIRIENFSLGIYLFNSMLFKNMKKNTSGSLDSFVEIVTLSFEGLGGFKSSFY
jgi:hypothetical protein